jgi:hypothetical protein
MDSKRDIEPGDLLRETVERPIGVTIPAPLSQRLDGLVLRAEEAGARVYRKDLVAALILAAPETPEELLALFTHYRQARAVDAALADGEAGDVLRLERTKPGRRPRRQSP